jgi:hypothetical protein
MDSSSFRKQRSAAKWEKGAFALPNRLVQDKNLTDSAFRLLAWMVSCSDDWVIYQTDIMNRFDWGREKLKGAIDNLIEFKYLVKFPQRILENGKYGPCDYEFSDQGYTDDEIKEFKIKFPMYGDPTSGESTSADPTSKQVPISTNPNPNEVCKREDPPLEENKLSDDEKPERINGALTYRHMMHPPKGEPYEIEKEEIYRRANDEYAHLKWTNPEIAEAWESLINSKAPIISPWRYLEGTIEGIRMSLKKKQQAQYCKRNSITTNNIKDDFQCHQQKNTFQTDSTKKLESCKKNSVEKTTSALVSPHSFKPIQLTPKSLSGSRTQNTSSSGPETQAQEKPISKLA